MKKIRLIALSAAALLVAGCGVTTTMSESEMKTAALVESYINNHEIYIEVDTIIPQRGGTRHTVDGYFLKIKDGKASSYLPFFGTSYMSDYAGVDQPQIEYKNCPVTVYEEVNSKGKHTWTFSGKSGNTEVTTKVEFFTSGAATITCSSNRRSVMTYHGTVMEDTRKISK